MLLVWAVYATPTILGGQLDALKSGLLKLHDPGLLVTDMSWFRVMATTHGLNKLFSERTYAPRIILGRRLEEQLKEGVDWCLPL